MPGYCKNCQRELEGRMDKKFCTPYCKSNYHYEKNKGKIPSVFKKIDYHLKKNRLLLKKFNLAGKATVREEKLLKEGFNPRIFTHYWKNAKGGTYLFCYEYGFMKLLENNKYKYSLITWQSYMKGVLDDSI